MLHHFFPYPRFVCLLGLVLSLFSFAIGVTTDAKAENLYTYEKLSIEGATTTTAVSINNSGQVAGNYFRDGSYGFVYSNGLFTTFSMPNIQVTDINNNGQVVGTYSHDGVVYSFVYSNGVFTTIYMPGTGYTAVRSINDSGQVAGNYDDGSIVNRGGFVYSNGIFTIIPIPGAIVADINNSGQVVGFGYDSSRGNPIGFVYSNGVVTTFAVPGAYATYPHSINDRGQVIGIYGIHGIDVTDELELSTFVYSDGKFTKLPVSRATSIFPTGINNSGQIVGNYGGPRRLDGFVYSNGEFTILGSAGNKMISEAWSINDRGQVAGTYHSNSGIDHYSFIATPKAP